MADPITTIALAGFLLVANGSGNGAGGPLPLVEYMGEHAKANCTLAVAQEENMIDDTGDTGRDHIDLTCIPIFTDDGRTARKLF
jgi:hypothetical protein